MLLDFIKFKTLPCKHPVERMKRQAVNRQKIFANNMSDRLIMWNMFHFLLIAGV